MRDIFNSSDVLGNNPGGIVRGNWAPNTDYVQNDIVINSGTSYYAKADFTSGSSFNASNWNTLPGGGGVSAETLNGKGPRGSVLTPETYGALGDGVEFTDGAITTGTTILTTAAAPQAVVGQRVYIEGAGPGGAGLRTTVAPGSTSTTITIADAASTTVAASAEGFFGTDDTAAFNAISTDVSGVWNVGGSSASLTILLDAKKYVLDGAPGGGSNTIWRLGITGGSIKIVGVSGKTTLLTSRNAETYTAGQNPKVMGAPCVVGLQPFGQNFGRWEFTGITIKVPKNPTVGGLNAFYAGRLYLDDFTVTTYKSHTALPTNVWNCGIILPGGLNFGEVHLGYVLVQGFYCSFSIQDTAHLVFIRPIAQNGVIAYGFDDAAGGGHAASWLYAMAEHTTYVLGGWTPDVGAKSKPVGTPTVPISIDLLDIEDDNAPFANVAHVLDTNSILYGKLTFLRWSGGIQQNIVITGAKNLKCEAIRPSDNGAGSPFVQVFTASGTWNKPGGITEVDITAIGGGGGGQSGGTAAAGVGVAGGEGGGAAACSHDVYVAAAIPDTVGVTIGAGGAGGAAVTALSTGGGWSGKAGGASTFGVFVAATGGSESILSVVYGSWGNGARGGAPSTTVAGIGGGNQGRTGSGGAGGGISAANAVLGFGFGGAGSAGSLQGTGGGAGSNTTSTNIATGGGGGAGGAAALTGAAQAGGLGGTYGGGGGGGGAARNTGTSGAGGNGATGIVIVRCR